MCSQNTGKMDRMDRVDNVDRVDRVDVFLCGARIVLGGFSQSCFFQFF